MSDETEQFEALMRRALAGDKAAYAQVLRDTASLLRPFLARRLSRESDVEDLLQEILLALHKARRTYDGNRPFRPWVYAIARFRLQDYLRRHYNDHLRQAVGLSEIEHLLPHAATEVALDYDSIDGEIRKLPHRQAEILRLMHHDGYTAREVAQQLGMSVSAVKVAAHRAYKVLRQRLER